MFFKVNSHVLTVFLFTGCLLVGCLISTASGISDIDSKKALDVIQKHFEDSAKAEVKKVRESIELGADVNAVDKDGFLPLVRATMAAALCSDGFDLIDLLLQKGANIEREGPTGITPLIAAAMNGDPVVVNYLLDRGANVNGVSQYGRTALYHSVRRGTKSATEVLIWRGANVNALSPEGVTPLHLAVAKGHEDIVRLLLEKGADICAIDQKGKTPLVWAKEEHKETMIHFLKSLGASDRCL